MTETALTRATIRSILGQRFLVKAYNDDKAWVEFVDLMPHPETDVTPDQAVVSAARTSFLGDSKGDVADKKLLNYLFSHMHTSPFEQVTLKFRINAPLVAWWQIVRHRVLSLNLQSGRYTPFNEDAFYIPTEWRIQSTSNKQGSDGVLATEADVAWALDEHLPLPTGVQENVSAYLRYYAELGHKLYSTLLEHGVAREQARLFLPGFAAYYMGVVEVDAHNLMHFLRLRMDEHAQWEVRQYALTIYDIFKQVMPWTAEAFERWQYRVVDTAAKQSE